jgi:hypothetical protein
MLGVDSHVVVKTAGEGSWLRVWWAGDYSFVLSGLGRRACLRKVVATGAGQV